VAHSYSDITPIPMLDIKIDNSNFLVFLEYAKSCLDIIEELNDKPLMGYLPNLPREQYPKLLDFYASKQKHNFCANLQYCLNTTLLFWVRYGLFSCRQEAYFGQSRIWPFLSTVIVFWGTGPKPVTPFLQETALI
jgi:hypothetical protein